MQGARPPRASVRSIEAGARFVCYRLPHVAPENPRGTLSDHAERRRRRDPPTCGTATAASFPLRRIPLSPAPTGRSTPREWSSCPAASTCTAASPAPRSTPRRRCGRKRSGGRPSFPDRASPVGNNEERPQHLRHRLPLRRPRLHLRLRRRHPRHHGAPHARRVRGHPLIDKGFYVLMGNNQYILRQIAANEPQRLKAYVAWLLGASKAYACKLVNPGGVETWKSGGRNVRELDATVRALQRHAATDHPRSEPRGERARPPAPGSHPLQQPRPPGELGDDTRHDAVPRRPPGAPDAHPVPQLRRRPRQPGDVPLARSGARRCISTRIPTSRSTSDRSCSVRPRR